MFTRKVTDDDNFTALSSSAQALYLHLSMSADDDGFCNQVSLAMFKAHASVQDLQALLERRYLYQFENGVIVIKHWRMANALRKDRYTPTTFQEEFKRLGLKDNGSYTWLPSGCQVVAERLPQDKLSKDKLSKDNTISVDFDAFWSAYPKKVGKQAAIKSYEKALKLTDADTILKAIERQKKSEQWTRDNGRYIPNPTTWLNQGRWDDVTERDAGQDNETRWNIRADVG